MIHFLAEEWRFLCCCVCELAIASTLLATMLHCLGHVPKEMRIYAVVPMLIGFYWPKGPVTARFFFGKDDQ